MRAQVDLRHGGFSGNFAFSVRELPGFFGIRRMPIIKSRKETVVQAKTVPISNWQATTYRGSSNPKPDANEQRRNWLAQNSRFLVLVGTARWPNVGSQVLK